MKITVSLFIVAFCVANSPVVGLPAPPDPKAPSAGSSGSTTVSSNARGAPTTTRTGSTSVGASSTSAGAPVPTQSNNSTSRLPSNSTIGAPPGNSTAPGGNSTLTGGPSNSTNSTSGGNSTIGAPPGNSTAPGGNSTLAGGPSNSTNSTSCAIGAKSLVMPVTDKTDAPKSQKGKQQGDQGGGQGSGPQNGQEGVGKQGEGSGKNNNSRPARRALEYIRSLFVPRSYYTSGGGYGDYGGGSSSDPYYSSYGGQQYGSSRPTRPVTPEREFIGYHGTNGENAQIYMQSGGSGTGVPTPRHFNGADAELGPGLYVADQEYVAQAFASGSAASRRDRYNRGDRSVSVASTYEYVCIVKARRDQWYNTFVPKVWITASLIARSVGGRNNPEYIQAQKDLVRSLGGHYDTTVRFSVLQPGDTSSNQMVIPPSILPSIVITECAPSCQGQPVQYQLEQPPPINYYELRQAWGIVGQAP